jgi:hypothetical protein
MCGSLNEVVEGAEILVITKKSEEFLTLTLQSMRDRIIIDLARLFEGERSEGNYSGIGW